MTSHAALIPVILVSVQSSLRAALAVAFSLDDRISVRAEASSLEEAKSACETAGPHIAIVEHHTSLLDATEFARWAAASDCRSRIIVVDWRDSLRERGALPGVAAVVGPYLSRPALLDTVAALAGELRVSVE